MKTSLPGSPESVFHTLFPWNSRNRRQKDRFLLPHVQFAKSTNKQANAYKKNKYRRIFLPSSPAHLAPNVVGKSLQGLSTLGDQSGTKMMHQERTHLTAKLLNAFSLKLCGNGSSRSCRRSHGEEVAEVEEDFGEEEKV